MNNISQKPAQTSDSNALDIGIFGDSISKGIIFEEQSQRYCTVTKEIRGWTRPAILHNFSVMGCTIRKGMEIIKKHLLQLSDYKNVFLEFGGNDCDFNWQAVSDDPDGNHLPNTPPEEFETLYTDAIRSIQNQGGNPVLLTMPPLAPERYFNWISKGKNAANILKWLGNVDTIYRWQEMYNMKVTLLAQKLSVPLIDIRSAFLSQHHYRDFLCADGIHPNRRGHHLIYNTIRKQYSPCI
jgi:acyl-CoA thioesterase-1